MQRAGGAPRLKLRQLEQALQEAEAFEKPSVLLEQYPTPADLAARMLYTAEASFADVEGAFVADLGTGCGVLAIGCALLGAEHVVGVEIDAAAARVAAANASALDAPFDLVLADVAALPEAGGGWCGRVDTVVMNPPFGTKAKGADMLFLHRAMRLVRPGGAVYSLHKTSTRDHVRAKGKEWGAAAADVLAEMRFPLGRVHKFHKQEARDVAVDLWRFQRAPPAP